MPIGGLDEAFLTEAAHGAGGRTLGVGVAAGLLTSLALLVDLVLSARDLVLNGLWGWKGIKGFVTHT